MALTDTSTSLLPDTVSDAVEITARNLASTNHVEEAWFLRGVADALSGEPSIILRDETHEYRRFYSAGYNSIRDARASLGV